jgi:hypothetical protein
MVVSRTTGGTPCWKRKYLRARFGEYDFRICSGFIWLKKELIVERCSTLPPIPGDSTHQFNFDTATAGGSKREHVLQVNKCLRSPLSYDSAECNYRRTYEILVSFVAAAALNSIT